MIAYSNGITLILMLLMIAMSSIDRYKQPLMKDD
jgi:Co/Zn/Cd efflux system component